MSSGRNYDKGFSFEVCNGRQQMTFGVHYDDVNKKFVLKCKTSAFGVIGNMTMGDVIHSEQTMIIDETRARVLLNSKFWDSISEWSAQLREKLEK